MWLQLVTMVQNCLPKNRELTAHVCNLRFPAARICWNRNNTGHPKRRYSAGLHYHTFVQSANTTSSDYMMAIFPAEQKSSAKENGRKGPRTGTDALSVGNSHHVHGTTGILLSLDIHRSNMEKVSTYATQTQIVKTVSRSHNSSKNTHYENKSVLFWTLLKHNAVQDKAN